jgi:hypothetical protein
VEAFIKSKHMQHEITIKEKPYTLLLGYSVLKKLNKIATQKTSGDFDLDDFEEIALAAIQANCKAQQNVCDLKIEDITEAFENDIDLALEVQVAIESFFLSHSQKRESLLKRFEKKAK